MMWRSMFPLMATQTRIDVSPLKLTEQAEWMLRRAPRSAIRDLLRNLKDRKYAKQLRDKLNELENK